MVVSEPSGETEEPSKDTETEKSKVQENVTHSENQVENKIIQNNVQEGSVTVNNGQDNDSGIEIKAAIVEAKEGRDEPDSADQTKTQKEETCNEIKDEQISKEEEENITSPKSLKELSDVVVRGNSTSGEDVPETKESSENSEFASFESAFPESKSLIA